MRIGKKLFPYPTLNKIKDLNSFISSNFALSFQEVIEDNKLILRNLKITINNDVLEDLISKEKAQPVVIVECSSTLYRKIYNVSTIETEIIIPIEYLRDKIEISSYIYAVDEFEYYSEDFLLDYGNNSFYIKKNYILAIDDGYTIKVDFEQFNDKKVSSIFKLIKVIDKEENNMSVRISDKLIFIDLPEKYYNFYDTMKYIDKLNEMFFSILIIPAIIYSLQSVINEYNSIEEILIEHSWFRTIEKRFEEIYKREITIQEIKDIGTVNLAQKLMDNSSMKSIESLFENTLIGSDDYDE